ncbi:MAG: Spermidine synthase [Tardiphaga sp.]|uniref:spermine/spermidine synthase domain-containing protein n=1 Tax=Tardiphaga sp. TaxID=1926292 RepID=UPI002624A13A|nr:spermidine synthase [Tardiphaga sp.]MDB5504871.1 Spermidine synthase [Tardiphaga sp.]
MSIFFEELDFRPTSMGVLTLRRRRKPGTDVDVYEIKLGDEFLMSSAFTAAEIALADIGLSSLSQDPLPRGKLDVVVGGLGLGYTAQAVLTNQRVGSLIVVDALHEVIEWHQAALIPVGRELSADPRCRLVHGDFFTMATSADGSFDPAAPGRRFDAVLVDIDHAPDKLLHPSHAVLYTAAGLRRLADHLKPGGVFALWSNDPPEPVFQALLGSVFGAVQAHVVSFENLGGDDEVSNTVYVGTKQAPAA